MQERIKIQDIKNLSKTSCSPSVVSSLTASAKTGKLLEIQILGLVLNLLSQKLWDWCPAVRFNKPSR